MSEFIVKPGDRIHLAPEIPPAEAPGDIEKWLWDRGWVRTHGDSYSHGTKQRHDLSWTQAVACEFYEFITLGGENAENKKG